MFLVPLFDNTLNFKKGKLKFKPFRLKEKQQIKNLQNVS